jgi:glycosyltransferase involved in cell wall biosynthesis
MDYEHLPDLYRNGSVLAAPSLLQEPFGLQLVEAMATALPVVASRAGGMAGIVEDGVTGLLIERNDTEALAAAITAILCDPQRAGEMGRAGRAAAEARFGWERVVARLEELYEGPGRAHRGRRGVVVQLEARAARRRHALR